MVGTQFNGHTTFLIPNFSALTPLLLNPSQDRVMHGRWHRVQPGLKIHHPVRNSSPTMHMVGTSQRP